VLDFYTSATIGREEKVDIM